MAGKAARNKRRELEANTVNAIAVAVFLGGFLEPLLRGVQAPEILARFLLSVMIAVAFHHWARTILGGVED